MWKWLATVLALFCLVSQARASGLPVMDFQSTPPPALVPVPEKPGMTGGMTGLLPEGWRDDSAWAEVSGAYAPEEFEGTRYLRVRVDRVDRGSVQLAAPYGGSAAGSSYLIKLWARALRPVTFNLLIRQSGPPYKIYWSGAVRVTSPTFEEIVMDVPALPALENPLLLLQFGAAGTVDFRGLQMAPAAKDDAPASGAVPKNLLRQSRFPLGPQSGMSLYREVSDESCTFAADDGVWGPSGVPALHVNTGDNKPFYFDGELIGGLRRGQPHTASIWVRGNGTLILSAMSAREGGARTENERLIRIKPENGWQRAVLGFQSAKDSPSQFVRYQIKGEIWMDAAMVVPGSEPPPFAGQGAAEVALALPGGEASLAGIQFEDEPAKLRWAVSGGIPGTTLRAKVTTAAGGSAELAPIPLGGEYYQTGELDFGKVEGQPLGAFRVEAAVSDASGKSVSPWSERVVVRVPRPRYWGRIAPESAFGQHVRPARRHILMAKALGNNWARLHNDGAHITDWASLEPKPGEWKWSDAHLAVLGQFSTAPKWASYLADTGIEGDGGYFGKYFLPKDPAQFANYVKTLAGRYKGKIHAYEVWNEPWQVKWFGEKYVEVDGRRKIVSPPDAEKRYAELCKTARVAARAVDPDITIIGLNTTSTDKPQPGPDGVVDGLTWSAGFIKAGGLNDSDAVSFHTYDADANGFPGDAATRAVEVAVGPNKVFPRIQKPVWMSEGSSTVGGRLRFGLYKHTIPYQNPEDVAELAESVVRYDLSMLANGVEKIFLYSMGDFEQGTPGSYRSGVTLDGSAHPAAIGRSTLAWHVDGLRFAGHIEPAKGVHAWLFEGQGRAVAVLTPRPDHAPFTPPQSASIRDLWMNPVPSGSPVDKGTLFATIEGTASDLRKLFE
jgi:hypothetical protein